MRFSVRYSAVTGSPSSFRPTQSTLCGSKGKWRLHCKTLGMKIVSSPLKYRECDLDSLQWLTLFQMIDFSGDFAVGCRDLLKIWGVGLREEFLERS